MKNKIKKIVMTTIVSVASVSALGCATTNSTLAKKINKGMDEFVSSINNLDYVDTSSKESSSIGKIVSASAYTENRYLSPIATTLDIENTITRPTERTDNFKLYVLSETPYVTLTSNDSQNNLNINMQFSTEKIENVSDEINEKVNELILKRSILMIYVNEIQNGHVNLSDENRTAINAYVNVIKENASFLRGNRGLVKNQLNLASDLLESNNSGNLVNYYIIKSGEALEIRSNKIDSTISAIDSIINIVEQNLTNTSSYYQTNLSETYTNLISNISNSNNQNNENNKLAQEIAESLNIGLGINTQAITTPGNNSNQPINNINNNQENINENQQISTLEEHQLINQKTQNSSENNQNSNIITNDTTNEINQRRINQINRINQNSSNTLNNESKKTKNINRHSRNNKNNITLQDSSNNNTNQKITNKDNYPNNTIGLQKTKDIKQNPTISTDTKINEHTSISDNTLTYEQNNIITNNEKKASDSKTIRATRNPERKSTAITRTQNTLNHNPGGDNVVTRVPYKSASV